VRVALGLGSNVGDRERHLRGAVGALREALRVLAVSRFLETDPVGGPSQGPYLNAAVVAEGDVDPRGLLALARKLEAGAGRVRGRIRWAPRPLDVDILLVEGLVVKEPDLEIPHPRLHERRFVLEPLAEIAPDWIVPGFGLSVRRLLEDLRLRA
jgi:2-amino-4-hydroxy-6-hydroxymethyldihydropteridine diphosphokinase